MPRLGEAPLVTQMNRDMILCTPTHYHLQRRRCAVILRHIILYYSIHYDLYYNNIVIDNTITIKLGAPYV